MKYKTWRLKSIHIKQINFHKFCKTEILEFILLNETNKVQLD
jgi:hypothetical protein